jgi:hypothetical protein
MSDSSQQGRESSARGSGRGPNDVSLIFIINGQEWTVRTPDEATLRSAVERALAASQNTARPADEWEVRTVSGVLLDTGAKIEALGVTDGAKLFLTLRVGAGGTDAS